MLKFFTDIQTARATLDDEGGWLFVIDGGYVVSDDEGTVADICGRDFIAKCEATQIWDETNIPASA